ncbi:MAG: 50S ribosomal protein L28 [Oscillospiraceae bacterium]|jgi:large subunit ribosomal protein L28|nr:50S ribosomal protein L28 [Oscillospiraceae bacterium]
MGKCEVCGKTNQKARKYQYRGSQVTKRTKRIQKPNVKKLRVIKDSRILRMFVCSRCIRSDKIVRAV